MSEAADHRPAAGRAVIVRASTRSSRCSRVIVSDVSGAGLEPGVVRSFTLATRADPASTRIVHHYGDQYAGWPADFFMGHGRLLATHATPARFRSIVAPIAARLMQEEKPPAARAGSTPRQQAKPRPQAAELRLGDSNDARKRVFLT